MGFSAEEVIVAIQEKLQERGIDVGQKVRVISPGALESTKTNGQLDPNSNSTSVSSERKSQVSLIGRVVESLLLKAPKSFLSILDASEFAEVAQRTTKSLESWTQDLNQLYIEPLVGKDLFYVSVVMKDCPFIINTFDNALERLGLVEIVTLHPIIALNGTAASVGVLVFSGISTSHQAQIVAELNRILPLLTRICADFGNMTQGALNLSEHFAKTGRSLWALDVAELLRWLTNGGFVFLGSVHAAAGDANSLELLGQAGMLAFDLPEVAQLREEIRSDYARFAEGENLRISKLTLMSLVHYPRRVLHIAARDPKNGSFHSYIGTLTSRAISEEAASIPVVRLKLDELVRRSNVPLYGYDHKALVRLINTTPKHHLLISDVESLDVEIKLVQEAEFQGRSLARISLDQAGRGVSTMLAFASSSFYAAMRGELQRHLELRLGLGNRLSDVYLTSLNDAVARFYFYTPVSSLPSQALIAQLEDELEEIALGWSGRFEVALEQRYDKKAPLLLRRYGGAFQDRYQALTSPDFAVKDLALCETATADSPIRVRYDEPESNINSPSLLSNLSPVNIVTDPNFSIGTLSIVKLGIQLTLGQILPVLENFGLDVIDSETLELLTAPSVPDESPTRLFLHRFFIQHDRIKSFDPQHFNEVVVQTIEQVLLDRYESDSLNALLVSAKLSAQAVLALRTYYHFHWQVRKAASRASIRSSLTHNPNVAKLLWQLFSTKFDPAFEISIDDRTLEFEKLWSLFQDELKAVKDITEDAVLKALVQLILHTVRTNFFTSPSHIAHKFHSEKLPLLRGPRPMYETFVYGPMVEGIHLRSSKVSRGGIRWSDRREDYRTEVLGLMRVQRIKNAIAVPGGAKGGFVVRESPLGQPLTKEQVIAGYKEYIRALLSIADNLVDGIVVGPEALVIYDPNDPYLVVAADKGTASFSDFANEIAVNEYRFWLNDGFASGGSRGYSHKDLGITARGAWECTKQHFYELGIDSEKTPFSVVGIGDMSGDVFGNGLLLSRNMKLVAAFDHRHVFIDPNPNLALAYDERERLFALPRSSWADYKREIVSEGGGIYGRLEKDIQLSKEAREVLGVPAEEIGPFTGEQVISFALKAPVELLWNGGIGTYVKSSIEVDSEVNDSANDSVRVNGPDLRARVVAEGGNVGFTQNGRVEYALKGGRINTDSIDNSAGVDLSDHEVNLKILFQGLASDGLCSREERDSLLRQMSEDVAFDVLTHNRNQAFIISVAERASRKSLDYFRALIRELCDKNYLTRASDGLPSDDEMEKRALRRIGLTRPEIAVCLAGMKLWIKDELVRSGISKDPALEGFIVNYFPAPLRERFRSALLNHPLAENIAAAQITNYLIDLVGITFIHRLQLTEGIDICDALRATIAASAVLGGAQFLARIEALNTFARRNDFFDARLDLGRAVRVIATQLIHRFGNKVKIAEVKDRYKPVILELFVNIQDALPEGMVRSSFDRQWQMREQSGLSTTLSKELSFLHISWLMLDAADLATKHSSNVANAHRLLVLTWETLGLEFLVLSNQSFGAKNKWEHELLMSSYDSLRNSVAIIGSSLCERGLMNKEGPDLAGVKKALELSPSFSVIKATIAEFTTNTPEVAVLHALARHLENFRFS